MGVTPSTGMPFDVYQVMQATMYGTPQAPHYPNSENVRPPAGKDSKRVVEPSTRTDVNIDVLRRWVEQKDRIDDSLEDLRLRAYFNKEQIEQGAILDIEV